MQACPFINASRYSYGLRINTRGPLALAGGKPDEAPQQWSDTGELLVPVLDMDDKLWAAQSIDASGRKSFPRGSKLQGGHFVMGEPSASEKILITEGYATGAILHELTGLPVVVAFHAGNLPVVAEAYREKYPEALLLLAGDNDHSKPPEKNAGRQKAEEAAQNVGGYTLLPEFGKNDSGSDWNDLVKQWEKEVVQDRLKIEMTVAEKKQQWARKLEIQQQEKAAQMNKEPEKALVQSGGRSLSV